MNNSAKIEVQEICRSNVPRRLFNLSRANTENGKQWKNVHRSFKSLCNSSRYLPVYRNDANWAKNIANAAAVAGGRRKTHKGRKARKGRKTRRN
jgi:predicted KAP-like P-loop ATPase